MKSIITLASLATFSILMVSCAVPEPLTAEELADIERAEADAAVAMADLAQMAADDPNPNAWTPETSSSEPAYTPSYAPTADQLYPVPTGPPTYNTPTSTPSSSRSNYQGDGKALLTAGKTYEGPSEAEQELAAQKQRDWDAKYKATQEELRSGKYNYENYKNQQGSGSATREPRPDYSRGVAR
jgi:hypothetical protein